MKIHYIKKRLKHHLIFGMLWLVLGSAAVIFGSGSIFNYGYVVMAVLYLGTYFFENNKQYLSIENGTISKNQLLPKKINLGDITHINKFAGDYTLKTNTTELKINTQLIDKKSLTELDMILQSLNLEPR